MSEPYRRRPAGRPEDDHVIGRALRLSALVAGGGLVMAAVAVLLVRGPAAPPPPEAAQATAPREAPRAAVTVPALPFTDIARQAGVAFRHVNGAYGESLLPETMGGGVAFFDADADRDMDLLLVSSGFWPRSPAPGAASGKVAPRDVPKLHLYLNDGTGHFVDATPGSGLDAGAYAMGVAAGDYDGDGRTDLYLTAVGPNQLFRNLGDGRFEDVTAAAGVAGDARTWSSSAVFTDLDRDGDLDLFVTNYVAWSREMDLAVDYRLAGIGRAYGPPANYPGSHNILYRNDGDGTFTDVSADAGIRVDNPATGKPAGKGLAVLAMDVNGDGWPDLIVANDTVGNFLMLNRGDGTFREAGTDSGIAYDNMGAATGAMGIDAGWFHNDDTLGIAIGNFANEMSSFYVTENLTGAGGPSRPGSKVAEPARDAPDSSLPLFTDEAAVSGIGASSRRALTFGVLFLDVDLDGRQDYLQVNGHVEDEINLVQPSQQYAQPAQLFWNCGAACSRPFTPVPPEATGDLARPVVGRGAAYADIDADGDLDLAVTTIAGPALLLRNDAPPAGRHWLRVRLRHEGSANRFGIGARVIVETATGDRQQRLLTPARSYLSQVEPVASFGLGAMETAAQLTVVWPDGLLQHVQGLGADRDYELVRREGPDGAPVLSVAVIHAGGARRR